MNSKMNLIGRPLLVLIVLLAVITFGLLPTLPASADVPGPVTTLPPTVYNYALAAHLVPSDTVDEGPLRCDYKADTTKKATVTWTDGAWAHTVTGDVKDMSQLYIDILGMEAWETCTYLVRSRAMISYGESKSKKRYDALDDYIVRMCDVLDVQPTPEPTVAAELHDYVLNTNTKVFHVPSCSSVSNMKSKNRKDVHKTRDEVVSMGYKPCDRCKP